MKAFDARNRSAARFLLSLLSSLPPHRAQAEDRLDFRYEQYQEERGRIEIGTTAARLEKSLTASLTLKGALLYDSISGATPTGGPPLPGSNQVPMQEIRDIRRAGTVELAQRWGPHTVAPQFAYGIENDYESYGLGLRHSIDFNNKNTTLTLGVSHNFDRLLPANSFLYDVEDKDTTDGMIGVTQLLSPTTILTVNLILSYAAGYLADPYKGVRFDSFPDVEGVYLFPESRPHHKNRQMGYVEVLQSIKRLNASVEAAYRIHRDSFGIWAHTGSLGWNQNISQHLIVQPSLRIYDQTAAPFYTVRVPAQLGDPQIPLEGFPEFYSADYRVSSFRTWTYGLKATMKLHEHFWLEAAYKRYEMSGHDNLTFASAYPKANVLTLGIVIWF